MPKPDMLENALLIVASVYCVVVAMLPFLCTFAVVALLRRQHREGDL